MKPICTEISDRMEKFVFVLLHYLPEGQLLPAVPSVQAEATLEEIKGSSSCFHSVRGQIRGMWKVGNKTEPNL